MRHILWGFGLVALMMAGCVGGTTSTATNTVTATKEEEDEAPHKGKLFKTEDKAHHHLELVTEKDKPAVAYLYDKSLKKSIATSAKTIKMSVKNSKDKPIEFKADPQKGDEAGKASAFKTDGPIQEIREWKDVEFSVKIDDKDFIFVED